MASLPDQRKADRLKHYVYVSFVRHTLALYFAHGYTWLMLSDVESCDSWHPTRLRATRRRC